MSSTATTTKPKVTTTGNKKTVTTVTKKRPQTAANPPPPPAEARAGGDRSRSPSPTKSAAPVVKKAKTVVKPVVPPVVEEKEKEKEITTTTDDDLMPPMEADSDASTVVLMEHEHEEEETSAPPPAAAAAAVEEEEKEEKKEEGEFAELTAEEIAECDAFVEQVASQKKQETANPVKSKEEPTPVKILQSSLAEALKPYNVYDPIYHKDVKKHVVFSYSLTKKTGREYIQLKLSRMGRQTFPSFQREFWTFTMATPFARIGTGTFDCSLYPKGTLKGNFYNPIPGGPGPELQITLTDESLVGSDPAARNEEFAKFHDILHQTIIPIFKKGIKSKGKNLFAKAWTGISKFALDQRVAVKDNVTHQVIEAWKAKQKELAKSKKQVFDEESEMNETELESAVEKKLKTALKEVGNPTDAELEKQFEEYMDNSIKVKKNENDFGDKILGFKYRMLRPVYNEEEKTMAMNPSYESITKDYEITNILRNQNRLAKEQIGDKNIEEARRAKFYIDNTLPCFRLLSPAEAEDDPEKESLIQMTPAEVQRYLRPGDIVSAVFNCKFNVVGEGSHIGTDLIALIWFANGEQFKKAVESMGNKQGVPKKRVTFAFAQRMGAEQLLLNDGSSSTTTTTATPLSITYDDRDAFD